MEVSLSQILAARESRAARQQELLKKYGCSLICFTMNIAGPVKNSPLIREGFRLGQRMLRAQFSSLRLSVLHEASIDPLTGCEGYYAVNAPAETLKRLCVEIEDSCPVARLFDMDVLDAKGKKISREDLSLPGRKCLLCDNIAPVCARSRAHSVEQLQAHTQQLLTDAIRQNDAETIASLAVRSLLYEVATTPKPGLVDLHDCGSHRDMDIFTFLASSAALQPYFAQCARIGMNCKTADIFPKLRLPGKLAELTMLEATEGVNTHKGAIFSLGILCAAAGSLDAARRKPDAVSAQCRQLLQGMVQREFAGVTESSARTAGQKLYIQYSITGIRGQAEAGFPAVMHAGLPKLQQGLRLGYDLNRCGCAALLALIAATDDTNLIARSDRDTQLSIVKKAKHLLGHEPFPDFERLQQWNENFIARNLSPGGSADLLAVTYFLHFLDTSL